jgi:hypothetical protein
MLSVESGDPLPDPASAVFFSRTDRSHYRPLPTIGKPAERWKAILQLSKVVHPVVAETHQLAKVVCRPVASADNVRSLMGQEERFQGEG